MAVAPVAASSWLPKLHLIWDTARGSVMCYSVNYSLVSAHWSSLVMGIHHRPHSCLIDLTQNSEQWLIQISVGQEMLPEL